MSVESKTMDVAVSQELPFYQSKKVKPRRRWQLFKQTPREARKKIRNAFEQHVTVVESHKIIYVQTPKCATTTMLDRLIALGGRNPTELYGALHDKTANGMPTWRHFGTFEAFVKTVNDPEWIRVAVKRNPYDRALSAYLDKIAYSGGSRARLGPKTLAKLGWDGRTKISFLEFLELVAKQPVLEMNGHWRPQVYHIHPSMIEYDYLIELSNIEDEFREIEERIAGGSRRLRWHKKTGASNKTVEHYCDRSVALVQEIYGLDFELLGYPTEFPAASSSA